MAKKKGKRASWFKVFLHQKALIDAVSDEDAGKALKAALQYFDNKTIPDLDPLPMVVFATLKEHIDESFDEYQKSVSAGRDGANNRWATNKARGDSPPIAPLSTPVGGSTEAEAETEAETETEAEVGALSTDFLNSTAGIDAPENKKQKEIPFDDLKHQAINKLKNYPM